jgi:hypothetical protein
MLQLLFKLFGRNKIEIIKYFKKKIKMTEYTKCPICYNKKCNVHTACNHEFCDKCIITWISNNEKPTCPICRHSFSIKEKQNIIFHKRATRSDTFSHRKKDATKTLTEMMNKFVMIPMRKDQIIEAKNICKFMYNSISYFKKDTVLINTFIGKMNELENDGVKECSIIRFKLRERNIIA